MKKTNNTRESWKHKDRGNRDPDTRRAYRLREIEAETGIPVSTLRTMVRRGQLNPITGFGTWLITKTEYEHLLQTRLRNESR